MSKVCEVGKIVVNECLSKGLFINAQKLQKLLVLMQLECIKRSEKPLFPEDIVIWDCGVAIKEVDTEFRANAMRFEKKEPVYILLLEKETESVDYVLDTFGELTTVDIMKLRCIQKIMPLATLTHTGTPHISSKRLVEYFKNEN